jgi:hypothetical protein
MCCLNVSIRRLEISRFSELKAAYNGFIFPLEMRVIRRSDVSRRLPPELLEFFRVFSTFFLYIGLFSCVR